MRFYKTPATAIHRALPYYETRHGRLTQLGGQIGMAVGIASRLAPLAFKSYGKYLMRGGLFGVLADAAIPKEDKPVEPNVSLNAALAKSALLSQLFTVFKTSKKGTRFSSLRSALLLAGVQKALPVVATWAAGALKNRKAMR